MSRPTDEQLGRLGASLREIDPSTLQQEDEALPVRWFLGENGSELFVWGPPGQPRQAQLVFSRVSLEWTAEGGLRTGSFQHGASTAGGRYDPYLLTVGTTVDPEVCRAALVLLRASRLEPGLLAPLLEALASAGQTA